MPGFCSWLQTSAGRVPQISARLKFSDQIGSWRVRWGIGRSSYLVPPGLYAIGAPGSDAPVIVTANYKMSYDIVRSSLAGRNAWLLILETFGINVWCAAGKGSFGTAELVYRLEQSGLERLVSHRTLILPILGAPGVAAHEIAQQSGFKVRYAAIRATDLPEYLDNDLQTTAAMQKMTFSMRERLVLIPVELGLSLRTLLPVFVVLFLAGWLFADVTVGTRVCLALLGAVFAGTVVMPSLLPWLPGPFFAFKGLLVGLVLNALFLLQTGLDIGLPARAGSVLALTVVTAYCAMNFTGATPFTSLSGVRKEVRIALPTMAGALFSAVLLWSWSLIG